MFPRSGRTRCLRRSIRFKDAGSEWIVKEVWTQFYREDVINERVTCYMICYVCETEFYSSIGLSKIFDSRAFLTNKMLSLDYKRSHWKKLSQMILYQSVSFIDIYYIAVCAIKDSCMYTTMFDVAAQPPVCCWLWRLEATYHAWFICACSSFWKTTRRWKAKLDDSLHLWCSGQCVCTRCRFILSAHFVAVDRCMIGFATAMFLTIHHACICVPALRVWTKLEARQAAGGVKHIACTKNLHQGRLPNWLSRAVKDPVPWQKAEV